MTAPPVADLADALTEAEWFLAARKSRTGLTPEARAVVARVWCGPGDRDCAVLSEAAVGVLAEHARDRLAAEELQAERDRLRNTLTVIRMIVEESATNDADLLRQAILDQLPPTVPAQHVQDATESHVAGRTAALAGTSPREGAAGPQEAETSPGDVERCAHCGKPRNGYGNYLGAKVCHTNTLPPQSEAADCYRLLSVYGEPLGSRIADPADAAPAATDYRAQRRQQNPRTPPPACPDCGMPETNCCCG